jgi:hypothetical protein
MQETVEALMKNERGEGVSRQDETFSLPPKNVAFLSFILTP